MVLARAIYAYCWGGAGKTITRYESHQVQDKAHDTILKKIDQDPEWFLSLLNDAKTAYQLSLIKNIWRRQLHYLKRIKMHI